MEKITKETVTELLEIHSSEPVVTIYAPMHKAAAPPNMTEDQIRFKNLVHKAGEQLKERAGGKQLTSVLCEQLERLLEEREFWENQTEGLLLCASKDNLRMFHLPVDTEEYVAVDNTFHLAPVLGMLHDAREFYVLVVALHTPALFKGDIYGLFPTDLRLPETLEAGLNIDENNLKSEQGRSAGGSSQNTAGFNGRGGARDPREEDRLQFLRMIDKKVNDMADRSLPLILAGTDSETAEFRHLSKYPKILEKTVSGSFGGVSPHELFEPAYAIVREELVNADHQQAVADYEHMRGANPERAAHDKAAITEAAEQGRVDTLLAGMSRLTTDTASDNTAAVERITFPEDGLSVSINELAAKVWRMSGTVINLDASQMPDGAPMVARLRY
jgi:hypothetical protein